MFSTHLCGIKRSNGISTIGKMLIKILALMRLELVSQTRRKRPLTRARRNCLCKVGEAAKILRPRQFRKLREDIRNLIRAFTAQCFGSTLLNVLHLALLNALRFKVFLCRQSSLNLSALSILEIHIGPLFAGVIVVNRIIFHPLRRTESSLNGRNPNSKSSLSGRKL